MLGLLLGCMIALQQLIIPWRVGWQGGGRLKGPWWQLEATKTAVGTSIGISKASESIPIEASSPQRVVGLLEAGHDGVGEGA